MRLPKEILVRGEPWAIKRRRNRIEPDDARGLVTFGLTTFDDSMVEVLMGLGREETLITFVHELLHVIAHAYGIELKHETINKIQRPIALLILENFL